MKIFTQKLSLTPKAHPLRIHRIIIVLGAFLLVISTSATFASETEQNELKEQQQKLRNILDKIVDAQEQRAEQKILFEKLSGKMQCNWSLIQDYDACDKKYKEQKKEQLMCSKKSKERARECLSKITN